MSKSSRIIIGLGLLLAAGAAQAQQPRTLTLDEALALARKNNRDLRQAKARVDQARAGVGTAWAALLPNVTAQGKYTHNYKEVTLNEAQFVQPTQQLAQTIHDTLMAVPAAQLTTAEQSLKTATFLYNQMLGQELEAAGVSATTPAIIQKGEQLDAQIGALVPLVVPFAYPQLKAAHRTVDSAQSTFEASDASVLFATAQAYYACAGTDELVTARQHAVAVAQKALDNAKARLEAGVVNRVEVTRAELQLVRARQTLLETFDSQASAYRALGTIMNFHEPVQVAANQSQVASTEGPVAELTQQALNVRPEFKALHQTLGASKQTVLSDELRWLPSLSAFGNAHVGNYAGFSGDKYSWAVGLQLDWTIYDGGLRDAQRKLAKAQAAESEAKLDLLRDQVADDVFNAERTVKTKRQAVDTAQRSKQLSQETLDLVTVQHEAGTATQLDLLQAQDALVGAEVALAQARFDLALGALSLDRVSGAFPNNRLK